MKRSIRAGERVILFVLISLYSIGLSSAQRHESWLAAMAEVIRLPDPLDARAIGKLEGWPVFSDPRCVVEPWVREPNRKCWAQASHQGAIRQATLQYYSDTKDTGGSKIGTLDIVLADQPCTTIEQAEIVFEKRIHRKLGPEPRSSISERTAYYQVRLFGDGMQMLTLDFIVSSMCITAATLSR